VTGGGKHFVVMGRFHLGHDCAGGLPHLANSRYSPAIGMRQRRQDYPALTVSSQIATKGYVSNLFVRDNQLISLSLAPEGYNVYFVEIKDLP
jgi:hypothetical protein